ncbi:hypothetical protein BCR39DRAFT_551248 [Naematelia encephala]|uniref:Trafficking protein particle complex subunit 10 n=1 Tax=Naematelia encephala TaxID=71784 RepID=A0A1Y2AJ70_9TREE|nr:hypothetical protein BCR39DRAFT_551248 [Naematelia encephala]
MPPRSVLITYTLHPSPSSPSTPPPSAQIRALQDTLHAFALQFPLRNLHWKSPTRTALRTIQELDVRMVELGELGGGTGTGRDVGSSVLEAPLVNLCLVVCEDAEIYKTQTRSFIRDWLSLLAARRTVHAPLIILVHPPTPAGTSTSSSKTVFGRDKGILGRLKTDFNTPKRDLCVAVALPASGNVGDPTAWAEVVNRVKEAIVLAFDGAIREREDEVKRAEAQRVVVGWNFCTWFLLKESLAHSFEGVNLPEDALIVYEELEATFFQILKEQNLSWFGKLGATGPQDDSLPILDTSVKPYRDMLQTSSISIFDFRVYLFARQAALLGTLGRITEIAKRGQWFVASLTRRLRENEAELAEHFIESWTYTACMDIVNKCDEWSRLDRPSGDYSGLIAYESARSELLDIARVQVERIGVATRRLPDVYPFSPPTALVVPTDDVLFESSDAGMSDQEESEPPVSRPNMSNRQLLDAVDDETKFRTLYLNLTNKAIMAYEACGKINSVIRPKTDLVALALSSEDWPMAYDLSRALAKDCAELRIWEPVASFALFAALRSHGELQLSKDDEWVNLALAYLRAQAVVPDQPEGEEKSHRVEIIQVVQGLRQVEVQHTVEDHQAFSVRIVGDRARFGDKADTCQVDIEVTSRLALDVSVDAVQIELDGGSSDDISFIYSNPTLKPGKTVLSATCYTSVQGVFTVCSASISLGSIRLVYPILDEIEVLHVKRNPAGPSALLKMPYQISLDSGDQVVLEVRGGHRGIYGAKVSVASISMDVQYMLQRATSDDTALRTDEETIEIGDVAVGQVINVAIPCSGAPHSDTTKARIIMTYAVEGDGLARTYMDIQTLSMGLPLTVNVQDFFRSEHLISHFTIASDGREYLRVQSVELKPADNDDYMVEACRPKWNDSINVTPSQPLSSLFKIRPTTASAVAAVLRLVIRYRNIEDEVGQVLNDCLENIGSSESVTRYIRAFLRDRTSWMSEYLATEDLAGCVDAFLTEAGHKSDSSEEVEQFLSALEKAASSTAPWRTLDIPVEVPQHRLITTVNFSRTSSSSGLVYEGRALAITAELSTCLTWIGTDDQVQVDVIFDIQANPEDWSLLGRKKGSFIASPDHPHQIDIVLVPMRSGIIFFPAVSVHLLDPPSVNTSSPGEDPPICETYVSNAAEYINVLPAKGSTTALVPLEDQRWEETDIRRM